MKTHFSLKHFIVLFALVVCQWSYGAQNHVGTYVGDGSYQDVMIYNCWHFGNAFTNNPVIGSHRYDFDQYYYAAPYMFTTSNNSYVDDQDLAFYCGHGNSYYMACGSGANVTNMPLGDNDLEFMVFFSCNTVVSAPERSDWWTPYCNMFKGLHMLLGFRSLASAAQTDIPFDFASRLKSNWKVKDAWFTSVDDERYWIFNPSMSDGSPYPGWASCVVGNNCLNDRLGSYAADPAPGCSGMWNYWQY
ncbi:MAG TPA: DUF6345 domain-containing protein [Chitinophagales bacterium]|nr:DUF6345 domain-containing protein [Chitinophagales bacterium]HRK28513.1 DUF6345 domain-containing protein [Chitinophagales bacterium]